MRVCTKCGGGKPIDEFHKDASMAQGRSRRCKECAKAHSRKWNAENKERKSANARTHRDNNKAAIAESNRAYRQANLERKREADRAYASANSARAVERVKMWRQANIERMPARRRHEAATRRARIRNACPVWADHEKIAEIYALADRLSRETGIPHDVDHIYPISGRKVCGLHVHQNLRVIPASENRKKSNKLIEGLG